MSYCLYLSVVYYYVTIFRMAFANNVINISPNMLIIIHDKGDSTVKNAYGILKIFSS